LFLKAQ